MLEAIVQGRFLRQVLMPAGGYQLAPPCRSPKEGQRRSNRFISKARDDLLPSSASHSSASSSIHICRNDWRGGEQVVLRGRAAG
ncbi:hypothetical protein AXF42_Ash001957 [Apostasia shenzhenica]|uniref:Uncharacterized protein n=1 Tax=Apostasia shenzhenica TaxID=1088818 RepID=A0A2I0ABT8_9ASPA|nr:hypothetical protein AXF42_Ash001957 [Apostasia shenzhenica]